MLTHEQGNFKYLKTKYVDRDIHDYFYSLSFKGIDIERSQFLNLFKAKEFIQGEADLNIDVNRHPVTLEQAIERCTESSFNFSIASTKKYPAAARDICTTLDRDPIQMVNPPNPRTYEDAINKALSYAANFNDFLLTLDENAIISLGIMDQKTKDDLLFLYSRDREKNDTGKLIYRMHSMGFLEEYEIDYNLNSLFKCTFKKYDDIDRYIPKIEQYLRRYLSETKALDQITQLKTRLTNASLTDNILTCLNFLAEFSNREIANKKIRATDEVQQMLLTSLTDKTVNTDWFTQNLYIKEQIYFYFNAKYARIDFRIDGQPYSLVDDYHANRISKFEILGKYLDVFHLDGTEQNNYKHMIGSCKKMQRSLPETVQNEDWVIRLLKAFAMYSINNLSYVSEANGDLESGFDNLYKDVSAHNGEFEVIEPIFTMYFQKLAQHIRHDNHSFKDIKLIRSKLLLKMQVLGIDKLISRNLELTTQAYA